MPAASFRQWKALLARGQVFGGVAAEIFDGPGLEKDGRI
jgi:hypothetical protein